MIEEKQFHYKSLEQISFIAKAIKAFLGMSHQMLLQGQRDCYQYPRRQQLPKTLVITGNFQAETVLKSRL